MTGPDGAQLDEVDEVLDTHRTTSPAHMQGRSKQQANGTCFVVCVYNNVRTGSEPLGLQGGFYSLLLFIEHCRGVFEVPYPVARLTAAWAPCVNCKVFYWDYTLVAPLDV